MNEYKYKNKSGRNLYLSYRRAIIKKKLKDKELNLTFDN